MDKREKLKKIIQDEDQEAYNDFVYTLNKGDLEYNIAYSTVILSRELGSVFGYQQAIDLGYTPSDDDLFYACRNGQTDVVDFLLQFIHPNDSPGALTMAIHNKDHYIIDRLLQAGATPTAHDGGIAVLNHDITLVQKLYLHGLLPTAAMAEQALQSNDVPMLKALLDIHPGLEFSLEDCPDRLAFEFFDSIPGPKEALSMLESHDRRCVLLLVVNAELAEMVIDYTLENNSIDGLEAILKVILDIQMFNDKLITIAARMNYPRLINLLLRPVYGNKVPGYDYPLIEAIALGNKETVEVFLRNRMPSNIVSLRRMTPVMLAVANDDVDILTILLRHNVSTKSIKNYSPLTVAIAYNSLKCFGLLPKNITYQEGRYMEINQGVVLVIDLDDASPEMIKLIKNVPI